ncbi:hypothetical protein [Cytobacillus oceanisediminis]|uniref:hypothetical protein n=1 Tax=Cytobacillus oceanisediminis TaxID=665099 RepID=UPI0037367635
MAQIQRKYNFVNGSRSDAEQVDEEFDNLIQGVNTLDTDVQNHKTSSSHDGRYYTKDQLNQGQLDDRYYIKSQTDSQISKAVANSPTSKFIEVGTSFPSSPSKGQSFFHEGEGQYYVFNTTWQTVGAANSTDVAITDNGGYFNATNAEGALQEIGQTLNSTRSSLVTSANNILGA